MLLCQIKITILHSVHSQELPSVLGQLTFMSFNDIKCQALFSFIGINGILIKSESSTTFPVVQQFVQVKLVAKFFAVPPAKVQETKYFI